MRDWGSNPPPATNLFNPLHRSAKSRGNGFRSPERYAHLRVGLNLAFDPIDLTDLQSSVLEGSEKELNELVRLSRARAAADFDCRHEARELLLPLGAWSVSLPSQFTELFEMGFPPIIGGRLDIVWMANCKATNRALKTCHTGVERQQGLECDRLSPEQLGQHSLPRI